MSDDDRRPSPLVNALWGAGIHQTRVTREHWKRVRWRLAAIFAVIVGVPLGVGLAVGFAKGNAVYGLLAGGGAYLAMLCVSLLLAGPLELRRQRKRRAS